MDSSSSFLGDDELARVGFGAYSDRVRVSRFARIYAPERVFLGDDVRIDDFVIISPGSGEVRLDGYNHVAASSLIFGSVTMKTWSTLSSRCAVYARSDDFVAGAVTYPHVPGEQRRLVDRPITIGHRVVIGTGSTLLPGADVHDEIAVGAMSLVTKPLLKAGVYAGVPARYLRAHSIR